jgi:hypothetical protein
LVLRPDYAEAHFNRGNVFLELQRLPEAVASYDAALGLRPGYAECLCNLGIARHQSEQFAEALDAYGRAIQARPQYAKALFNRGMTRLLLGDFAHGWPDYEWRLRLGGEASRVVARRSQAPQWTGREPIDGKVVLLHAEQGYGDTLQWCRYARHVEARGARVIFAAQKSLRSLLAPLPGMTDFVGLDDVLPPHDYQCPLMSLPLAFQTRVESIPDAGGYLRPDIDKVAAWQQRLGFKRAPRIGLVWSGSATNRNERNRCVALAQLLEYLPPGFEYFRLQKDIRDGDLRTLRANPRIVDFSEHDGDFADAAALCANMDLVISVCTSVAHLSAALGRPTWILLGAAADWRWLRDRDDSPWYTSVRLIRQPVRGEWRGALERIPDELAATFTGPLGN